MANEDLIEFANEIRFNAEEYPESKIFFEKIKEYNACQKIVKGKVEGILARISEFRNPTKSDVDSAIESINQLQEQFSAVSSLAEEFGNIPTSPETSIKEIISAVGEECKNGLKKQISACKETLTRFINVKALLEEYAEALSPFQHNAQDLLAQLQTDNEDVIKTSIGQAENNRLFLELMDTDPENHSDEKLDTIENAFGRRVVRGLMRGKYVDGPAAAPIEEPATIPVNEPATVPVEEPTAEPVATEAPIKEPAPETVAAEEPVEKTASEDSETLQAIFPVKKLTVGAAKFFSEFSRFFNFKLNGQIVPAMSRFDLLTESQLSKIARYKENLRFNHKDLEDGGKRNLYAVYDYTDENGNVTTVSCLTQYCRDGIQKESNYNKFSNRFFRFTYNKSKGGITGTQEISKKSVQKCIYKNNLLFNYFDTIRNHVEENDFFNIINGVQRKNNSYEVPIVVENQKISCFMILRSNDAEQCVYKNILIIADIIDIPTAYNDACENVYVIKDGAIYKCSPKNGSVVEQLEEQKAIEPTSSTEQAQTDVSNKTIDAEPTETEEIVDTGESLKADTNIEAPPPPVIQAPAVPQENVKREVLEHPTAKQLIALGDKPKDEEFYNLALSLLSSSSNEDSVIQALLLAQTAAFESNYERSANLSNYLQLATHLFLEEPLKYTFDKLYGIDECSKEIALAAYLQAMVTPALHDYELETLLKNKFESFDEQFKGFEAFKALYNSLLKAFNKNKKGFTNQILRNIISVEQFDIQVKSLQSFAKEYLKPVQAKGRNDYVEFYTKYINKDDSDFHTALHHIVNDIRKGEAISEIKIILDEFCENDELSQTKIEEVIDERWKTVCNNATKYPLVRIERKRVVECYSQRLNVLKSWYDYFCESDIDDSAKFERTKDYNEIITRIDELQKDKCWKTPQQGKVIEAALDYIKLYLTSSIPENYTLSRFSELLRTGFISLRDDGKPSLNSEMTCVRFNEPWLNVLKHICTPKEDFDEILKKIAEHNVEHDDEESYQLFDNLHQKEMICALRKTEPWGNENIRSDAFGAAEMYADKAYDSFSRKIELAYTYGQCSDSDKDTLIHITEQYKTHFYEKGDYAQWRWFLIGLGMQLAVYTKKIGDELKNQLDKRLATILPGEELDKQDPRNFLHLAQVAYEADNYALAEEYINRFDNKDEVSDYDDDSENEKNFFEIFLGAKGVIRGLSSVCKSNSERHFAVYAKEYLQEVCGFSMDDNDDIENRNGIIENWEGANSGQNREATIKSLFSAMGFDIESVEAKKTNGDYTNKRFVIKANPVKKSMMSYKHPIANYGTGLNNINLICFDDQYLTAKDLVETVEGLSTANGLQQSNIIVFANKPFDISYRRGVADHTHSARMHNNAFLLIDTNLMFFLSTLRKRERIQAMLQCTLPFSTYEPFSVGDSSVGTPDEMIYGRDHELSLLLSDKSPCFVYGGRQLGKTSLLHRAENLCHRPEQSEIAVYININGCTTEEAFVKTIVNAVNGKLKTAKIKNIPSSITKLDIMMKNIGMLFEDKNISSLFLLMDESDNYLEFIAGTNYSSLDKFISLRQDTSNKFRFVFAGLRNVSRAKNAIANNGTMGQFGEPLCIRPLKYRDATKLLITPLRYLGFTIAKFPYLDTILANTNYYPGMIQYYGNILVRNALIDRYEYKSSKQNPPFKLEREQLSKVMATKNLRESIQTKFMMSLEVDERYLLLAKSITALYYYNESTNAIWMGFSVDDIKSMIDLLPIKRLQQDEPIEDLLNEMVDMGILAHQEEKYRLRRRQFIYRIGKSLDAIEKDIEKANNSYEAAHGKQRH